MKTKIVIVLFVCLSFINCSEDKDDFPNELPAFTQEGKDTAGCLVDGELVLKRGTRNLAALPEVSISKPASDRNFWSLNISFLDVFFNERSGASIDIIFKSEDEIIIDQPYVLEEFSNTNNSKAALLSFNPLGEFSIIDAKTNLNSTGILTITKMKLEGDVPFIAGTFDFQANSGEGRVFSVTDGRFDLKIDEIN
ncbi:hypothetical protein [uncultured Tenacibaculum sp.]|uniref:hypothetical protein n=1 Tax=uncultured Tenacibaculum sp. TaxID=174713 RepID=UPI002629E8C9|nr:hypothetical protein [uncultured Tenacibaculum sp.]